MGAPSSTSTATCRDSSNGSGIPAAHLVAEVGSDLGVAGRGEERRGGGEGRGAPALGWRPAAAGRGWPLVAPPRV